MSRMTEIATITAMNKAKEVYDSPYALRYHIAAPSGWINDPNGLVKHNGEYHVFYQHYPDKPVWGPMHWGHVVSSDLAHWKHLPVALAPDMPYETGCFSGSAVDDNGTLTLIYTAHNDNEQDFEKQCIARSFDGGVTFEKFPGNPVISRYPEGCTRDFRDPKVWKQNGLWHMVVGSSHNGNGCALLYIASDLENWTYKGIMCESDGMLGNMWECPNFFRVDGQDVLIVSAIVAEHKNIAIFGTFDDESGRMQISHIQEVDMGSDFYAGQVMELDNRVVMIGWLDMWLKDYPTQNDGWAGALTIPRELHVKNGKFIQRPVPELQLLRKKELLENASPESLKRFKSETFEMKISASKGEMVISDPEGELLRIALDENEVSVASWNGRKASAKLELSSEERGLHVFVDRSSVEIFVNGGEVCFSERIYPKGNKLSVRFDGNASITAWQLENAFQPLDKVRHII